MTIVAETSLAKVVRTAISVCVASVASVDSVQFLRFEISDDRLGVDRAYFTSTLLQFPVGGARSPTQTQL